MGKSETPGDMVQVLEVYRKGNPEPAIYKPIEHGFLQQIYPTSPVWGESPIKPILPVQTEFNKKGCFK